MKTHVIRVTDDTAIRREQQLAWKLAELAADPVAVDDDVVEMIGCRVLDSIGVSIPALNDFVAAKARSLALAHPLADGATILGLPEINRFSCEWAAFANNAALRQRDMNDMFIGAEYAHPSDSIPALVALAQQRGRSGLELLRAIATAYEIQIALASGLGLSRHGFEPIGHLGPALAGGIGTLLHLPVETIYRAIQQAVHLSCQPRRMPEAVRSDWRVISAAHFAKLSIDIAAWAAQGLIAPSPAYESKQGIFARFLGGGEFSMNLPELGESKRAILASWPKAHRAQYQSQACIDLAIQLGKLVVDTNTIAAVTVHTSEHLHRVIGTAWRSGDFPAPWQEHDLALTMAIAIEDREWRGEAIAERACRQSTAALREKIATAPDPEWSRRSHTSDTSEQSFGAKAVVRLVDGRLITASIEHPRCHPRSGQVWQWPDYEARFIAMCGGFAELSRIEGVAETCRDLVNLKPEKLVALNLEVSESLLSQSCS